MRKPKSTELPSVPGWSSDAAQQFLERSQTITSVLVDWNGAVSQFVGQRIGRDVETLGRLAKCQIWTEAFGIETRWLQTAVDDYIKEVNRLVDLNSKVIGTLSVGVPGGVPAQSSAT